MSEAISDERIDTLRRECGPGELISELIARIDADRETIARLRGVLSAGGYHEDSACGACGGPLEQCRDAICERCVHERP